jgi:hypothetical protein
MRSHQFSKRRPLTFQNIGAVYIIIIHLSHLHPTTSFTLNKNKCIMHVLIGYKFCVRLINEKTIYFSLKYTEINKKKLRKSREKITSMQPNVQLTPGNKSNSLINSPILIIPTNPTPLLPNYPSLSLSLSLRPPPILHLSQTFSLAVAGGYSPKV